MFYAYGASAPDDWLLDGSDCKTIDKYFDNFGINLHRTIASDDVLADGIVGELNRRGLKFGPGPNDWDHVALISEWDTLYGRVLPDVVESKLAGGADESADHPWMHNFTYLKGLDGLLPSGPSKDDTVKDKSTDQEKQGSSTDFFKVEQDTQNLERPIGQSQFDYLRRISERLHEIDNHLRTESQNKHVKAIGIFGSDVFDKLLLLRALRPEFPEALFFTTDFDEAFTIKSELPFTRNLIISSSFGPSLDDRWQREIPLFRDTYQTSIFLAAQMAIDDWSNDLKISSDQLSDQLRDSRIFEIGRTGQVFSFHGKASLALNEREPQNNFDKQPECSKNPGACNSAPAIANELDVLSTGLSSSTYPLHPPLGEIFPTFKANSGKNLAYFLSLGAAASFLAFWRKWVPISRLDLGFLIFCFSAAAAICFFWEPLGQYLTGYGDGEPFALLDGISIWPTVLLRIISVILSVYFIARSLRDLYGNLAQISKAMGLGPPPKPLAFEVKFRNLFDFSFGDSPAKSLPLQFNAAWDAYIRQDGLWPRIIRAVIYTGFMYATLKYVLVPVVGMPVFPHRSELAENFYSWTGKIDWLLIQFLTFIVFDATFLCLLFVKKLSREKTSWPPETLAVYDERMWLEQKKLIHDWIDLDFVAMRTRCIGSLIYPPFILIALLIVSRSTMFANYPPSVTILISLGISLTVVFACSFMLWLAAKSARATVSENFKERIIRAKNSARRFYSAAQLETLLRQVDQLNEGAFSPLSQQPLVRALLFPLSSAGWVALIQNGMLPGL